MCTVMPGGTVADVFWPLLLTYLCSQDVVVKRGSSGVPCSAALNV